MRSQIWLPSFMSNSLSALRVNLPTMICPEQFALYQGTRGILLHRNLFDNTFESILNRQTARCSFANTTSLANIRNDAGLPIGWPLSPICRAMLPQSTVISDHSLSLETILPFRRTPVSSPILIGKSILARTSVKAPEVLILPSSITMRLSARCSTSSAECVT